jgi:lysozyme
MLGPQIEELKRDEGLFLVVYDDGTEKIIGPKSFLIGHPTIGYGRALDVHGISKAEAEYLLANDIAYITNELSRLDWFNNLDEVRRGVCINMAYNLGVAGFLTFRNMIEKIKMSVFTAAAEEMRDSHWFTQVQTSRSERLFQQMRDGIIR